MVIVKSSAPGKAILFGEHAVVHGVTAIAVALSDLRISCAVGTQTEPGVEVVLQDIQADNEGPFVRSISHDTLLQLFPHNNADVRNPSPPSSCTLQELKDAFEGLPLPAVQCITALAFLVANILPELLHPQPAAKSLEASNTRGLKIEMKSYGLPIGAGLGSSAAFCVAAAGGLLRLRHVLLSDLSTDDDENSDPKDGGADAGDSRVSIPAAILPLINGWAYAAEVIIHGNPSGLDNSTSCYGGALKFVKKEGKIEFANIPNFPKIPILLTNSRVPRSTKVLVANVGSLKERYPAVVNPILSAIEGIAQQFLLMLETRPAGDEVDAQFKASLGELVSINHHLLCSLGVGHASLDTIVRISQSLGYPAKLTGAGGGGCAITILTAESSSCSEESVSAEASRNNNVSHLEDNLRAEGFETFQSSIGGEGVQWL